MTFIIKEYNNYNEEEILQLYHLVGWTNYTKNPEMLKSAFQNSLFVYGLYKKNNLIGLIRGVGDGYSIIYIQDIIISPDYQRRGLGTKLINYILEKYKEVYQLVLSTDNEEKTIAFYKSLGFEELKDIGCTSFMKINV